MADDRPGPASHFFTLRLWVEELGDGHTEWRGEVRYVPSGAIYYFRCWDQLQETMRCCLEEFELGAEGSERDGP
jgi:hypothetical protein